MKWLSVGVLVGLVGCGPRIGGTVMVDGRPAVGEVLLLGEFSVETNAAGEYVIVVPMGWTGTVAIPRYGPMAAIDYVDVQADRLDQNWLIAIAFVEIRGTVMDETTLPAVPLADVTLEVRGATPDGQRWDEDVVTQADGGYVARIPKGFTIRIENYAPPIPPAPPPEAGAV